MPRLVEIDVIERELAVWRNWQAAFLRGDEERPSLPATQASPLPPVLIAAAVARALLLFLARVSSRFGSSALHIWAANKIVALDHLSFEPVSCGLNRAYGRLGLAKLVAGDQLGAIECLRTSWRVHPCPHNTSFGLVVGLWQALASTPGAARASREYEEMARKFCGSSDWPPEPLTGKGIRRSLTTRWS